MQTAHAPDVNSPGRRASTLPVSVPKSKFRKSQQEQVAASSTWSPKAKTGTGPGEAGKQSRRKSLAR